MGFILKQLTGGSKLETDGSGGNLTVISGKAKSANVKAWKDDGSIKKGDIIEGVEITAEFKNRGNVVAQTYDASIKKFVPSTVALADTFKATIFIPALNGLAYLKVLSDIELSQKIGILPSTATKPLIDGFSGILLIGENDLFADVMNGELAKIAHIKMFLFDEFQPKDCNLEFAVPVYKSSSSSQTEKDKLSDRSSFIQAVIADGSVEQLLFIKLATVDPTIATLKEFIGLMFQ